MKQIKVLVVEDSAVARAHIISILKTDKEIKIIGEAKNGKEALEKIAINKPDIITMDIIMPVMDGMEAIERIMSSKAIPILVITARGSAASAFTAISKGALEVIAKDDIKTENAEEFTRKIRLLSKVKVITHVRGKYRKERGKIIQKEEEKEQGTDKVIAIASSTGGPKALSIMLRELPENLPYPVVIAQHITDGFVAGLVEWLNGIAKLTVKEGIDREPMAAGTVYISPSEKHMGINNNKEIHLIKKKQGDIYSPSCDTLLFSAAEVFGANCIGIILTGMGHDGALGIKNIKEAGGFTIAQDEASSVVFGMPKIAIDYGCVDKILPIDKISEKIIRLTKNIKR